MNETARFKLNLITGEVEIEGSEEFVERQIQQLETVIETVRLRTQQREEGSEGVQDEARESSTSHQFTSKEEQPPASFGEWMNNFRADITDLDKALITARYVQSHSPENDFKTSEVNNSLKDHGIKLSNPSVCLKRLDGKKLIFQTRKVGSLKFMRVSIDGQKHLESLKRQG